MTENSLAPQPRFTSLQILRAVAAIMVVAFHISGAEHLPGRPWQAGLQAGVDVFFVISGFVMVISTAKRTVSPAKFMLDRLRRIVPLYWIALAITLVAIHFGMIQRPLPQANEVAKAALFVFYFDSYSGQPLPYLGLGWTLNYEMFFYVLFALTIMLPRGKQIMILAVMFACLVALRPFADRNDALALRLTSPMPFEFLGGMLIAQCRTYLVMVPQWLAAILMVVAFGCLLAYLPGPRTLSAGIPAALLVVCAIRCETLFNRDLFKSLRFVGDASYSLYLTHVFALSAVGFVTTNPIILFASAIILGVSTYLVVELPIEKALKGAQQRQRLRGLASV